MCMSLKNLKKKKLLLKNNHSISYLSKYYNFLFIELSNSI